MRLETLRVELRPRSPWEAVELGTALVRRDARAIWTPWWLLTLPVFALVNGAALAIGEVWLAWLAMWWLKPLFDRIPLFVLSRAVFGETPSVRQTLAAQRRWGWRAMLPALTWRRFSPWRALTLPIDLLEGADAGRLRERRRVLGGAVSGTAILLTCVCLLFVAVLSLSVVMLIVLFIPIDRLPESGRAFMAMATTEPPPWLLVLAHALVWTATSAIEPFYVGAGFGLYLNRRTQIEAWDVEIALRRLRARLQTGAAWALFAIVAATGLLQSAPAHAAAPTAPVVTPDCDCGAGCPCPDADPANDDDAPSDPDRDAASAAVADTADDEDDPSEAQSLDALFGAPSAEARAFDRAVAKAYTDPQLRPKRKEMVWEKRRKDEVKDPDLSWLNQPFFVWLAKVFGYIGEFGLWALLGVAVLALALTAKRWWPWLQGGLAPKQADAPVEVADALLPDVLPDDIVAAARRAWNEGRPRRALALLYRASVEAMAVRADVALVPGATESECLRASRRMPDGEDRGAFARMVKTWQYAAYAQRLPDADDFESLLGLLAGRFGWAR